MSLSVALDDPPCIILKNGARHLESDHALVHGTLVLKVTKATNIDTIEVFSYQCSFRNAPWTTDRTRQVILEGKTKADWMHGTPALLYMSSRMGTTQSQISEERTIFTHKSIVYPNPRASQGSTALNSPTLSIDGAPPDYFYSPGGEAYVRPSSRMFSHSVFVKL